MTALGEGGLSGGGRGGSGVQIRGCRGRPAENFLLVGGGEALTPPAGL